MSVARSDLVTEFQRIRRSMSREVALVFDHDDTWKHIMVLAEKISTDFSVIDESADMQAHHSKKLAELTDYLEALPGRVSTWTGPARSAFGGVIDSLAKRVDDLGNVSDNSSRLLAAVHQGRMAHDQLVYDLVTTSVEYAEKSLTMAKASIVATNGLSMSVWTTSNLTQVDKLVTQLDETDASVDDLIDQVTYLVGELSAHAQTLTDEIATLTDSVER